MWHYAFWEQAQSDWKAYRAIQSLPLDDCHALHYLQMTTEKLAKAMLLARGTDISEVRYSHKGFLRFLQLAARHPALPRQFNMPVRQFLEYVRSTLPLAGAIEHLAPALAQDGPNSEYPWQETTGTIRIPASYQFSASAQLKQPNGRKLLRLTQALLEQFESLFIKRI